MAKIPNRPRLISVEAKECLVDTIENHDIASYVVAARQQMREDNPFLFLTIEDAHKTLYETGQDSANISERAQKTLQLMGRAFLAGAYIAGVAYALDDQLPFMHEHTLDMVLAQYQHSHRAPELDWFDAILADSNMCQVIAAGEELLSQWHPIETTERMQTGAGFLCAIVNDAVIVSN